jgi:hypothetical protein
MQAASFFEQVRVSFGDAAQGFMRMVMVVVITESDLA